MNDTVASSKTAKLIFQRGLEALPIPALVVPLVFLLVVVTLFFIFRNREAIKQLAANTPWPIRFAVKLFSLIMAALLALSLLVSGVGWVVGMLIGDGDMSGFFGLNFVLSIVGALLVGGFLVLLSLTLLMLVAMWDHKGQLIAYLALCFVLTAFGAIYIGVGAFLTELPYAWAIVVAPTLLVGIVFIGAMYYYDSQSINPGVAVLLGILRFSVYLILTVCFARPAYQDENISVSESKVLVFFDVSGSMDAVDGQESGGITRQEKIIRFLTTNYTQGNANKTFIEHLTANTPVACYRFGAVADEEPVVFDGKSKAWGDTQWRDWFRPDPANITVPDHVKKDDKDGKKQETYIQAKKTLYASLREGTDVGGSVLQVLQREGGNRIQAIIIFSDGNSNRGDEEAIRQIADRASSTKRPIHVITVGVGDYKQPVRIRINPLVAPTDVRADDGDFEVRVPVFGDGLPGEEFEVTLEAQRVKDRNGTPTKNDPVYTVGKKKGKFGVIAGGEFPFDEVVFKVNLEQLTKIKADEDAKGQLQGQWDFVAKVPRHAREAQDKAKPVHVSLAKAVFVRDSILRVLLFASGPTREYLHVLRVMSNEVDAKRAKVSTYLQTAKGLEDVNQDVPQIPEFPNKFERPKGAKGDGGKKDAGAREGDPMNLKSYDVIIAFDPDWTELSKNQKEMLREWCEGDHAGGIIFVAGPQHTLRLIPPVAEDKFKTWDLKPIYTLFPVVLARPPAGVKADSLHDAAIPYTLNFTSFAKSYDFLKLDEDSPLPLGGWKEFFGKIEAHKYPGMDKIHPERGFYNYFQIKEAKPTADVIATFGDPKAPKLADKKTGQPYFVSFRVGQGGKSFYIGSGETWRLRTFKEDYHQRFWVKLCRYVSSGSGAKSFGRFSMAGEYVTGIVPIEAEVKDKDGFPLAQETPPVVLIKRIGGAGEDKDDKPPKVTLKAKTVASGSKWRGIFVGNVRLDREGFYEARIDITGTDESITQLFEVKSPNVELSDLRTNFPKLYNMATDATKPMLETLEKLDPTVRKRLEGGEDRPQAGPDGKLEVGAGARLFFRLAGAQAISLCITRVPADTEVTKGAVVDFWHEGPRVYNARSWDEMQFLGLPMLVVAMFGIPLIVMLVVIGMMLIGQRWIAALGCVGALIIIEVVMLLLIIYTTPDQLFQPSAFGVLLVVPPLVALVAAGILLIAERYFWVLGILVATVVWVGLVFLVEVLFHPAWEPMRVDFTWLLLAIGLLLSLEWFTRKMLRLA
jgi:hypothetical protein